MSKVDTTLISLKGTTGKPSTGFVILYTNFLNVCSMWPMKLDGEILWCNPNYMRCKTSIYL